MSPTATLSALLVVLNVVVSPVLPGQLVGRDLRKTEPSGVVFADHLLFESTALSLISCAVKCSTTSSCASFTFSRPTSSGSCRGHSKIMTSLFATTAKPGARLFVFADIESYFGSACNSSLDCPPINNTVCYNNQCTCTPGYFFQLSTYQCNADCPSASLGTTAIGYYHLGLAGHNDLKIRVTRLEDCVQACLDATTFVCLTMEWKYSPGSDGLFKCLLSATTVQKPGTLIVNDVGYTYYQRTCL